VFLVRDPLFANVDFRLPGHVQLLLTAQRDDVGGRPLGREALEVRRPTLQRPWPNLHLATASMKAQNFLRSQPVATRSERIFSTWLAVSSSGGPGEHVTPASTAGTKRGQASRRCQTGTRQGATLARAVCIIGWFADPRRPPSACHPQRSRSAHRRSITGPAGRERYSSGVKCDRRAARSRAGEHWGGAQTLWSPAVRVSEFMECGTDAGGLVQLDVGGTDHLGPLLGFLGDEAAEVSG
jgi:hypothetical protein